MGLSGGTNICFVWPGSFRAFESKYISLWPFEVARRAVWDRKGFGLESTLLPERINSRLGLIPKKTHFTEGICLCCLAVVGAEQGGAETPLAAFPAFLFQALSGAVGEHPVPGHQGFFWDTSFSFSS